MLPAFIHRRIEHRPNLGRILSNIGWLLLDKALRMAVGLLVSVWLARYLGPSQFGVLNYAIALVAIFGSLSTLGLNGIVVRELVQTPEGTHTTLGTALALQLLGATIAVALMLFTVDWLRPGDDLTKLLVAILGLGLVFQSTSVIKYWFESQVESRYSVWIDNGALLLMAAVKVIMIVNGAPLIAFAWVMLAEAATVAVGLGVVYVVKSKALHRWNASLKRGRSLLRDSWPLMIAGVAYVLYLRIDQVMLGDIVGSSAVGIYSAAVRVSEVWATVAVIFVSSVFPAIIESQKKSEALFKHRVQQLLNWLFQLSVGMAIVVTLSADWIVDSLFGASYAEAATVLRVHIWGGIFVFMGHVGGKWYIIKNLQRLSMQRGIVGLAINVVLNALLIPAYGNIGAAVASLFTVFVVFYAWDAINRATRELFIMKTRSVVMFKRLP